MNQEQVAGNWQQFKGNVKKHWEKLTDTDLFNSEGNSDILIGQLTKRYGISKEKAVKEWNKYLSRFDDAGQEIKSFTHSIANAAEDISDWTVDSVKGYQKALKEKPLTAVGATSGIAALAGVAIGLLISKSSKSH